MERYSSSTNDLVKITVSIGAYDVNNDGLLSGEEIRGLLLHLFSNCTYKVGGGLGGARGEEGC